MEKFVLHIYSYTQGGLLDLAEIFCGKKFTCTGKSSSS